MKSLVILSAVLCLSCASTTSAKASEAAATSPVDVVKPNGQVAVGDKTNCPVTGETFVVKADSDKVEYEGKTYYFCCDGCADDFKKEPAKFVEKLKAHAGHE